MTTPHEGPTPDAVAQAVAGVPVVRLHEGSAVATHLPGRRVAGVRLHDDGVEVHVATVWPTTVSEAAEAVRSALRPLGPTHVDVVVDDVVLPTGSAQDPDDSPTKDTP